MVKVYLKHLYHNKANQIAIEFDYDTGLIALVKTLAGAKWSQTHKTWYVQNNPANLKKIFEVFKGKAWVDGKALFNKKPTQNSATSRQKPHQEQGRLQPRNYEITKDCPIEYLNKLTILRYSDNTVNTYKAMFIEFINFFKQKQPQDITYDDIMKYQLYLVEERKVSASYQNQSINAIKFYFEKVLNHPRTVYNLARPRKSRELPKVLSQEDVAKIFAQVKNLKHKTILYLIYSAGLRRSELVNLKVSDIQSKRNLILIRQAKGKKDRTTLLSKKALEILRDYYREYKPKEWLFESPDGGHYSVTSVRSIFIRALNASGINKPATLHTLRHSFATHLLESGTDIRYIQDLMGHDSIKTTSKYSHVTKQSKEKIISPLDQIDI